MSFITRVFRFYTKYVVWVIIIAVFSYIFEIIYASGARTLLLTMFIVLSLGFVLYVTK